MNSIPPLQPTAIGFSLANAHALVQAAGLAYHPPNEVTAQALAWGLGIANYWIQGQRRAT